MMRFQIIINMPDPEERDLRFSDPGPRSRHLWDRGRCYDRPTAERLCLDIVERGLVRNATFAPAL